MAAEPLDDDNPIEEILLHGFPNPERVGCPPRETIQALAERRIGRDDPAWNHIWHCSPCFADFKEIRDARLARVEGAERRAKRKRAVSMWAAAAVACACLIAIAVILVNRTGSSRGTAVIAVDLTNAGTFRGQTEDTARVLAKLPRKLDELHITLPLFSPPGQYVLAILKSPSENAAIALGSATATGSGAKMKLVVTLDLSAAQPGRYYLATRREEQGQQEAAYYYPVLVDKR
ncbi:MAG TPA: hypothetical protein VF283_22455 [Bryobacteraceae bacterium]|nr:hypothetical protein [Candidatus Acidoferrales bacterium]